MTTTLKAIRRHKPCSHGWTKLLKHLNKTKPDDEPLSLLTVLESNGLNDAIWCLCTEPTPERTQRFALAVARRVEHLSSAAKALNDTTERYLNGQSTKVALRVADNAASASRYATNAVRAAEYAAYAARTALAAVYAVYAATNAASYAEPYAEERQAQEQLFREIFA